MGSLGLFFEKSSRMSGRARHRQPARSALSEVLLVAAGDFLRAAFGLVRLVGSRASLRRLLHDVLLRRALLRLGSSGTFRCHFAISLGCRIGRLPNQGWFTSAPQKKANQPMLEIRRSSWFKDAEMQPAALASRLDQKGGVAAQARGGLIVRSKKRVKRNRSPTSGLAKKGGRKSVRGAGPARAKNSAHTVRSGLSAGEIRNLRFRTTPGRVLFLAGVSLYLAVSRGFERSRCGQLP